MKKLKYNVDDEVLIKGKVVNIYGPGDSSYPYRIKFDFDELAVTSTDIFTESCIVGTVDEFVKVGENQKTYEQGLNDAWEMVKLISLSPEYGGLPLEEVRDIYHGCTLISDVSRKYSAQEAIDIYNDWKERNGFKMGDIVEWSAGGHSYNGIFYSEDNGFYWVLDNDFVAPQRLIKADWNMRKLNNNPVDILGAFKNMGKEI